MLIRTVRYWFILIGAGLISVQLRLGFGFGASLGRDYNPYPPITWVMLLIGAGCAALAQTFLPRLSRFLSMMIGLAVATFGIMVFAPDVSQLQIAYFAGSSIVIALMILAIVPKNVSFGQSIHVLWDNRQLLILWVRYNVTSRYSQTLLGILWIMILPVATSLILSFVFSYVFEAREIGDAPFIAFFLSGLTFWSFFTQGILNGTVSVISKLGLISQIYFPREILVLTKLGEALIDLFFVFVVTLTINAFVGVYPNINYIYLPFIFGIQVTLMLGIMFFLSYLTVIVRDIQQLTTVVLQMLFYLTPIMYPLSILPERLAAIVSLLNPMTALINAYREIILHNRPPDLLGLLTPLVASCVMLYNGYMFFKANERKLADFR